MGKVGFTIGLALLLPVTPVIAQPAADLSAAVREFVRVDAPVVALIGVRVVDGTGAEPITDQTVVIENGRIAAVGKNDEVEVPAAAERLELDGHTVIPGIVGLHNHLFYTTDRRALQLMVSSPRLYLGCGVTTIRTTGSMDPYGEINLKRAIEEGESVGPRMHLTGPYLNGTGAGMLSMVRLDSGEAARRAVGYWAEEGATWFKAYTGITREALRAGIEEAHRRGLKFTGHLCSVTFREAVDLGIDNLEHGLFTNSEYDPAKRPDECPPTHFETLQKVEVDGDDVQATIAHMIANGVALTSTPAVLEIFLPNRPPLDRRVLEAMAPATREEYLVQRSSVPGSELGEAMEGIFAKSLAFDLSFYRRGGLLAAGVDPTGNGGALPGFGDQRNYELLIEGGFTPVEAVEIMTANGAKLLSVEEELGSIAVGKLADLVVIEGDPIAEPAKIREMRIVFKDGVGYDSQKLIDSVAGMVGIE